ncbi:cobalamin biosynthesis protein CobG [Tropicibacter sp. R16_0]|uniref:cobalamin biosynthesis protein CobG n=1 Tax=Tropicibacter sp. R16_0 TaxID=2821102 RepID=UPI001ADA80FF|nr:cobalamin biosynthesis protein CobG [Tropicibacter sp. R16_0]MBO9449879.1 cobalamin biosynthesis protein CobG [Tropicibacter sp. R16_0]
MMSGDGLVVRVRPRMARLTADQVLGLCDVAERFGNGTIDLTNRANLQVRGVAEDDHQALLADLAALDLLDAEPGVETKRNILVSPLNQDGDLTTRLANNLTARLGELPDIPAKFGFAVDTGPSRLLTSNSADIRLERGQDGLILRADGVPTGRLVTEDEAIDRLIELTQWFCKNYGTETRRMARLTRDLPLPSIWQGAAPDPVGLALQPGVADVGPIYGAPFGALPARALADLMQASKAIALRVTPWRLFILEGGTNVTTNAFVTTANDPLLTTDACPGAPFCPQAEVSTRDIALALAPKVAGSLHVSGCAKGCARQLPADVTLIGADGRFDLVKHGRAGDVPCQRGLTPETLMSMDLT